VLNKENITITGISDRIKNYIFKLRPSYGHIHFHISEDISNDLRFGSQNALNVFRIVQEAMHNALKHSGAGDIGISISSNEQLLIKITDDGRGMDAGAAPGGNGLRNMQARAAESGLRLSILSDTVNGTVLQLQGNTPN
jgi:signal transduction histidine kinase